MVLAKRGVVHYSPLVAVLSPLKDLADRGDGFDYIKRAAKDERQRIHCITLA